MAKVYLVTSGCYSDYHVDAVTLTREDAEKYVRMHQNGPYVDMYDGDGLKIVEWDVWDPKTRTAENPVWLYEVRFDKGGGVIRMRKYYLSDTEDISIAAKFGMPSVFGYESNWNGMDVGVDLFLPDDNDERAVKRAAEIRAEYLAKKEGV